MAQSQLPLLDAEWFDAADPWAVLAAYVRLRETLASPASSTGAQLEHAARVGPAERRRRLRADPWAAVDAAEEVRRMFREAIRAWSRFTFDEQRVIALRFAPVMRVKKGRVLVDTMTRQRIVPSSEVYTHRIPHGVTTTGHREVIRLARSGGEVVATLGGDRVVVREQVARRRTDPEIAAEIGCTVGDVRRLVRSAYARLRQT